MPPKTQITKEMVLEAGFKLIRESGIESLNVRRVAAALNCSTQPVMYCFATVEELRNALYQKADKFHSEYLLDIDKESEDPMMSIGMNYIRFAYEEKHLFRFLFQTDKFSGTGLIQLTESEELEPMLDILKDSAEITREQAKEVFTQLFLTVHGIAALLANNSMEFDETRFAGALTTAFYGTIGFMKGEEI